MIEEFGASVDASEYRKADKKSGGFSEGLPKDSDAGSIRRAADRFLPNPGRILQYSLRKTYLMPVR